MSDHTAVTGRPTRSPSYPALDLRAALEKAEQLYRGERQNAVPVETAVKHWGYLKGPNGRSNVVVSALKKYGLIVDSGSGRARKIQVTDATRRMLEHPEQSERLALIKKAALLPRIHADMFRKYGATNMPSDDSWAWELKEDLQFTDAGAVDFIKEYRETIKFAELGDVEREDPDLEADEGDDEEAQLEDDDQSIARFRDENRESEQSRLLRLHLAQRDFGVGQTYPIPVALSGKPPVQVTGVFPLTEAEWAQFMAVLTAMKPVLVGTIPAVAEEQETSE